MKKLSIALLSLLVASGAFADIVRDQTVYPRSVGALSYGSLSNALTRVGTNKETVVDLTGGYWPITINTTVASNIIFRIPPECGFDIANGVTLTLNCGVDAGEYDVFNGTGLARGSAKFLYRFGEWGDTTQYNVGDGSISSAWMFNILTNDSYSMIMDTGNVVAFDTITANTGTVGRLRVTGNLDVGGTLDLDGIATFGSNMVLGVQASNDVFNAVTNNPAFSNAVVTAIYDRSITYKKIALGTLTTNEIDFGSLLIVPAVNHTNTFTTAQSSGAIQDIIDTEQKYIPVGVTVDYSFDAGTHTMTNGLVWYGFYGGGNIRIRGNGVSANDSLHTTQEAILDASATLLNPITVGRGDVEYHISNLRVNLKGDEAEVNCVNVVEAAKVTIGGCYFVGSSKVVGCAGVRVHDSPAVWVQFCYISNLRLGIGAESTSRVFSFTNDDTGTAPTWGLEAENACTIGKQGTQPTGTTADELTSDGGVIR